MKIVVKSRDTLWLLADQHLGDANLWPRIWDFNRGAIFAEQLRYPEARRGMRGPHWIFPGTVLQIPKGD